LRTSYKISTGGRPRADAHALVHTRGRGQDFSAAGEKWQIKIEIEQKHNLSINLWDFLIKFGKINIQRTFLLTLLLQGIHIRFVTTFCHNHDGVENALFWSHALSEAQKPLCGIRSRFFICYLHNFVLDK
jgi:hypothetical protein